MAANAHERLDTPWSADEGAPRGMLAWHRYRVFSLPWLWRRCLVVGAMLVGLCVLLAIGLGSAFGAWFLGLDTALRLAATLLAVAFVGPLLATAARHAHWPVKVERVAVVAAIVAGLACGYAIERGGARAVPRELPELLARPGGSVQVVVHRAPGNRPPFATTTLANATLRLGFYLLVGGGWALWVYLDEPRRLRAAAAQREVAELRRRAQASDLRLAVLQAQVEPHFLFNTLASLRSLIRQEPARAEQMLDALAEHLRATIPRLRADLDAVDSTLGSQLDLCRSYLALMQVRMGARLAFDIQAGEALRARPFPPLMLISLVENAIKHGIEPKAGPGRVDIIATGSADRLQVRVEDDGRGLQPGASRGIGLANIREQLAARYGAAASLSVEAREGGGVVASIELPSAGAA